MTGIYRSNHRWTEGDLEIVRCQYDGTGLSAMAIANKLGVTVNAVKGKVARLGLGKVVHRPWTAKEDERLRKLSGEISIARISQRMGRSINSVAVRCKRLKLSRRHHHGWFTKTEVAEILGKDHKWVQTRIDNGSLPATHHAKVEPQQNGGSVWHISEKDLKKYIRCYCSELNGRNVDLVQIVDILAGVMSPYTKDKI